LADAAELAELAVAMATSDDPCLLFLLPLLEVAVGAGRESLAAAVDRMAAAAAALAWFDARAAAAALAAAIDAGPATAGVAPADGATGRDALAPAAATPADLLDGTPAPVAADPTG